MDESSLRATLAGLSIPALRFFDTVGSTNDEALAWAEAGAPDWALVAADRQTGGRGRLGRRWVTNLGAALAFSLIIRLSREELAYAALFSPFAALGVADALEQLGLSAEVKWPNDVLLGRKKVCGILAEAAWQGADLRGFVIGIGVNVAPDSIPPSGELMFPATCVEHELGRPLDRLILLASILANLHHARAQIGQPAFFQAWRERLAFRDELVEIIPPGQPAVQGTLKGVDAEGNLLLTLPSGTEMRFAAGDVRLRLANEP
jgi:BirA family biotin operon repressor/biotin-[acetyl-CoA-carboxylase] ligase